ncbi:YaaA family protein [Actinoplanes sp. NPDC004185]
MIILLHSSKAMRFAADAGHRLTTPALLDRARVLAAQVQAMAVGPLAEMMSVTAGVAEKTAAQMAEWNADGPQRPALDCFIGDIYSGLQANEFTPAQRAYAEEKLFILSGMYGLLRPSDGIRPYRLEMGYRLPDPRFANLYKFWGDAIAELLPGDVPIVNLAAQEYSRTVTPFVAKSRVVTPKFLTVDPATGKTKFVVVHAKIARGAFARWLITEGIDSTDRLGDFTEVGYELDPSVSTAAQPVFVAKEFGGKGLSIRLK